MVFTKILSTASFLNNNKKFKIGVLIFKLGIISFAYFRNKGNKSNELKKLDS
jgi:hypothetical protein